MQKEEQSRNEKLEQMQNSGLNPYPSKVGKRQKISFVRKQKSGDFNIVGKIVSLRSHGKSTFLDLKDQSGKMQVFFRFDEMGEKEYEKISFLDLGDYIAVSGSLFDTKSGELTILAKNLQILAKTLLPLPDNWYGLKDTEIRYRKRFLDLIINKNAKNNLILRSKIISYLRHYMEDKGFMEVETPVLQSIPGGAAAKPFKTHYNILNQEMYLRIAPELYLKRLVVGGFEKVFEIGKNFRNEGLSHMHNPEFTMMEFYWAYKDYNYLMKFTQKLIPDLVKNLKGTLKIKYGKNHIDFTPPFKKIAFDELIKNDSKIDIYKFPLFEDLKQEVIKQGIDLNFKEITAWPKLVDELYKKVSRPKIIQPTFVIDHPLVLTPLAKAKDDDPNKAQRFQLVLAGGIELVNAYSEQNDPQKQTETFNEQMSLKKEGYEEGETVDNNFIEALKYGLPPTAGWGMGIERMAMILSDQYSIKEVIPFPTLKNLPR